MQALNDIVFKITDIVMNIAPIGIFGFVVWVFAAGLIFHFIAGVKHLLADLGFAEELQSGRIAATISLILSVVAIIAAFVWIMF
jgi:succinate dehydrogenase cytochrome b556 subunit